MGAFFVFFLLRDSFILFSPASPTPEVTLCLHFRHGSITLRAQPGVKGLPGRHQAAIKDDIVRNQQHGSRRRYPGEARHGLNKDDYNRCQISLLIDGGLYVQTNVNSL